MPLSRFGLVNCSAVSMRCRNSCGHPSPPTCASTQRRAEPRRRATTDCRLKKKAARAAVFVFRYDASMSIGPDPFSEESLRKLDEWTRANSTRSSRIGAISGYVYRGMGLALLYGGASVWGYQGVPEAVVVVAIVAYYCGRAAAKR